MMRTARQQKILRDLLEEGSRTVLVVFAMAVGIAGFTAVLSAYAVLTRELNAGYLATNPASATLRTDAVDAQLLSAVRSMPEVGGAEARKVLSGQIQGPHGAPSALRLFVVDNYRDIRIGILRPQAGAWPPAAGEILVERDAFQVAKLRIGDQAKVKTAAGKEQLLLVSGSVHDVGQAQARMDNVVYGYITSETLVHLGEPPVLDRLNIVVSAKQFDEPHIQRVAAEVRRLVESRGHVVSRVDIPKPGKHPHAEIMGLLLLSMSSFGFCILALSGIVVLNLLIATMAAQIRQIGVMKALGGDTRQIASLYFSQVLLLGAAAVATAIPCGILGGRQLCSAMAVFLNFDINRFDAPIWVYLLAAAAGFIVPVVSAAYPVWNGSRVPVRRALGDFGVASDGFGTSAFDRALVRYGGMLRTPLLSIRNSFRHRTRLFLTLSTLTAGGVFFLCALNVRAFMVQTLDRFFDTRKFDIAVALDRPHPADAVERAAMATAGVAKAEGWSVTDAAFADSAGDHFAMIALPPGSVMLKSDMAQGRNLQPGDTGAIVLNSSLASLRGRHAVGDTLTVQMGATAMAFRVVGIAREQFSPPTGYIALGPLRGAKTVNSLRVVLAKHDRAAIDAAKTALDAKLGSAQLRTRSMSSVAEMRYGFDQHMVMIYVFLVVVSTIIGAIGGLGLMTTMSLNVLERRREIGVLRAIGAGTPLVSLIVIAEGVLVALMSWIAAAILSWPLSKALGNAVAKVIFTDGLETRFEWPGLLVWLAVCIAVGTVASAVPAWSASRMTVRAALAHE